jgi:hypothetical protein
MYSASCRVFFSLFPFLTYFLDLDTGISSGSGGGGGHRLGCRSAPQRPAELSLRALNLPAGGTPCCLHHQQRGPLSVRSQGGASSVSSSSRAGSTPAGPAPRTLPTSIRYVRIRPLKGRWREISLCSAYNPSNHHMFEIWCFFVFSTSSIVCQSRMVLQSSV